MKTNVNMIRKIDNFDVLQRTSDGMFYATGLLKQWNESTGMDKKINHYLELSSTKEFFDCLESEAVITASADNQIVTSVKGGKVQGTWMHPYMFIDFAMWLNPRFKAKVIKFVYDNLVAFRHSAGDGYINSCRNLSKLEDVDYSQFAKGCNYVIFGTHFKDIRNTATAEQLADLNALQTKLDTLIEYGAIKNFEDCMNVLRQEYKKNHPNNVLMQ